MSDRDLDPSLLARALAIVPTHRQVHQTTQMLSERLARTTHDLGPSEAHAVVRVMLDMLGAFDALNWQDDAVRANDQVSAYLIRSLTWYTQHRVKFVDEVAGECTLPKLDLLRRMELRRVHMSHTLGIPAEPTREQDAALVLFARVVRGKLYLLFQWDTRAQQYQLIGGRIEPGETPHTAAVRECGEELGDYQLVPWRYGQDFTLSPILPRDVAIESTSLSPTYGALTRYRFFIFHASVVAKHMTLGHGDRWIPVERIQTKSDRLQLGHGRVYAALDASLSGGLAGVTSSFAITSSGASTAKRRSARQ